jgi:hypothetical protein
MRKCCEKNRGIALVLIAKTQFNGCDVGIFIIEQATETPYAGRIRLYLLHAQI